MPETCGVCHISAGVTSPCKAMKCTASEGKMELHTLNDRLASYISRVRDVRQSVHQFDPSSYRGQIASLEEEIVKVKDMYSAELEKLRYQAEQNSCKNSSLSAMYESSQVSISDLKSKLASETYQCEKLSAELSQTKDELYRAKREMADLTVTLESVRSEHKMQPVNCQLSSEFDDLKQRYECEVRLRMGTDANIKSLQERLSFESRTREQEKAEFEDRLKTSAEIIRSLEAKLKEVSSDTNIDLSSVLDKLRAGTMMELRRYQSETEEALNKNLSALRHQIDTEKSVRCGLNMEKGRLEQLVVELRSQLAATEGKIAGLIKQRDGLEESLQAERSRSQNHTIELEAKLAEMNNVMLTKVKECTEAREAQVCLKTEIDAFKALLMEGENRLSEACSTKLIDIDSRIKTWSRQDCLPKKSVTSHHHHHYKCDHENIAPRPPVTPRRRPTSAHSSCYVSRTHTAPVDDRVFHLHGGTEYRSSAGSGTCTLDNGNRNYSFALEDFDIRGTTPSMHKRVTLDFQPEPASRVLIKDDIEISGKGISSCYSMPFPKRNPYTSYSKCSYARPRSSVGNHTKTTSYCTY